MSDPTTTIVDQHVAATDVPPVEVDPALRQALTDVVRAQRLLEAFFCRARALIREVEVALLATDPALHLLQAGGYEVYSPTPLSLHRPEGWLRRWLGVFFAEPRFVGPGPITDAAGLKLAYLLINLDPATVEEAEVDLVLCHNFAGLQGSLPGWIDAIWHRGQFELNVPADGWYGRPDRVDLGYGASMRLQLQRVPLSRVPDREALQRELVERLIARYKTIE